MKIWQKNYDIDKAIEHFTVGKDRLHDLRLAWFDVIGSMAHIKMLNDINLISDDDLEILNKELKSILSEIEKGNFKIEDDVEDIHSQIEILLTRSVGNAGKKIHSGRSRNDQVLVDLKLFMRSEIEEIVALTQNLFKRLINLSSIYKDVLMPGYTHFQIAMPSSFGLWFGAYAESLVDDLILMQSTFNIINQNPLGSAAGYGTSFPLKRQLTTDLLGFDSMNYNVIYAQMGRGKAEKVLAMSLSSIADTLGKLAADICLYLGQNFGFISFPDEYTTGSSIMPHKKNPDVFELIRGKCNKVKAISNEISQITGNLPSGYHREMQLLKESLFEGIDMIKDCLMMSEFMIKNIIINDQIMDDDRYKYIFSVEAVNDLVLGGMSFRDAYRKVAEMIENGTFKPSDEINHTHEGSIGNLCNEKIVEKMVPLTDFFESKFENIKLILDRLKES